VFKSWTIICAAVLLAACGAPEPRPSPNPGIAPAPGAPSTAASNAYQIDAAHSELRILVYRAGPMARLGHNHVIVNRNLGGWVDVGATSSAASFVLRVPVADFAVDEAEARHTEGADFAETVAADAQTGTRRNMLSAAVLDADRFPNITLTSVAVGPVGAANAAASKIPVLLSATLAVELAGHRSTLVVPFKLEIFAGGLAASGTIVLRQSSMGISPLSIMFGALQVQDELSVKFRLVARAT
jgi:polyisoprenoid-binding protein YceI